MKMTGENRSTRGKTCPSATLSTTNPTSTDLGSNPGLRGARPAANRLSHGTAFGKLRNHSSHRSSLTMVSKETPVTSNLDKRSRHRNSCNH
jgi:hypothetical protein